MKHGIMHHCSAHFGQNKVLITALSEVLNMQVFLKCFEKLQEWVLRIKNQENYSYEHTGCHRRKGPNFGRVFLMFSYTDITQNTYIQSWTVTEIMAREKCGHLAFPRTVPLQLCSALTWREHCGTHFCDSTSSAQRDKIAFHYCRYVQCLVTLRTTVTWVRVFL